MNNHFIENKPGEQVIKGFKKGDKLNFIGFWVVLFKCLEIEFEEEEELEEEFEVEIEEEEKKEEKIDRSFSGGLALYDPIRENKEEKLEELEKEEIKTPIYPVYTRVPLEKPIEPEKPKYVAPVAIASAPIPSIADKPKPASKPAPKPKVKVRVSFRQDGDNVVISVPDYDIKIVLADFNIKDFDKSAFTGENIKFLFPKKQRSNDDYDSFRSAKEEDKENEGMPISPKIKRRNSEPLILAEEKKEDSKSVASQDEIEFYPKRPRTRNLSETDLAKLIVNQPEKML